MTVLDTFYVVFKTNSEEVKKGLTDVEKKANETEKVLKRNNEQVDTLGKAFVKMVEGGAALAGAWAGAGIIKNAVVAQTDYNRELEVTSKLYHTNIGSLSLMAQAAARASGNKEDRVAALQDMKSMAALSAQMGNKSYSPQSQMDTIRQQYQLQKNNPSGQQAMLGLFSSEGMRMMIQQSPEEYAEGLKRASIATVSDETGKNALAAGQAQVDLGGAEAHLEATIANGLIPAINTLTGVVTAGVAVAGGSLLGSLGLGGAFVAAKGAWGALKGGLLVRALGLGGSSGASIASGAGTAAEGMYGAGGFVGTGAAGALSLTGAAVGATALAAGTAVGYYGLGLFSKQIEAFLVKRMTSDLYVPPSGALTHSMKQGSEDPFIKFFMGKGYSKSQAAGIAANIYKESGGKANARGDNGHAYGLAQWHPDRAKAILNGTGIDIYNATQEQQMEAIAWEMNGHRKQFNNGKFKNMSDAYSAGSYFSKEFESPAASDKEAMARGNAAIALAGKYGGSTTVNVGDVTINTQATNANDIAAHIRNGIIGACKEAQTNFDTGRTG